MTQEDLIPLTRIFIVVLEAEDVVEIGEEVWIRGPRFLWLGLGVDDDPIVAARGLRELAGRLSATPQASDPVDLSERPPVELDRCEGFVLLPELVGPVTARRMLLVAAGRVEDNGLPVGTEWIALADTESDEGRCPDPAQTCAGSSSLGRAVDESSESRPSHIQLALTEVDEPSGNATDEDKAERPN